MNSSINRFSLNMHSAQSQISIPVLLGDTGRTFRISLSDGGNPYIIVDGCLAKLSIKRPTGTRLEEFCAIEDNTTIVYNFDQNENTAAVEGIHECDVSLYGLDGKVLTTARFSMVVSDRVVARDDVVLTDEDFTAVDAMLVEEAKRQAEEAKRAEAEAERISAEEQRIFAEEQRISAEEERISSEEERLDAEEERITAEEERKSAETARISAEIVRESNEAVRVSKDAERDASIKNSVDASGRAEENSTNALKDVADIKKEFGTETLITGEKTVKGAVNYAVSTADAAKSQSNALSHNLVNLSAQVQGIGRTFVVPNFSFLIDFLNSRSSIQLKEDRNGDGVDETYNVYISDLKSGDNIIIVEKGVPDFWFERNSALSSFETYPYNGTEHTLSATVGGTTIGGAHILETDYTVIEGYSTSASASAQDAKESALEAKETEASIDEMIDELYFNQIAPPYDELENSVFLATPTYEML